MFRVAALCSLILLTACATPRQQCESRVSKDLRVVDGLIAETRTNLERGYGVRTETDIRSRVRVCAAPGRNVVFCNEPVVRKRQTAVALDLQEERQKLVSLVEKRDELQRRTQADLATCRNLYAE